LPSTLVYPTYTINGWVANALDDLSCEWWVQSTNVTDGPGVKLHNNPRPFGIGSYRSTQYLDARPIVFEGYVSCPNRVAMTAARTRFLMMFPDGEQRTLTVDDGITQKQVAVERSEAPRISVWSNACGFDWQLPLYANDPRFLDATVQVSPAATVNGVSTDGLDWATGGGLDWSTGGGLDWGVSGGGGVLAVSNAGTADTWPIFTVTGNIATPSFTDPTTGKSIAYAGTVSPGQALVIDTSPFTRSVTLDGSDRFALLTSAQWFPIPPNTSMQIQFGGAGTGTATATWQNASV
jgi:hypothetical protein